ncbi:MAG: hypothetical protein ACO3A2_01000 [Bdellovibrionia bacterium]
MLYLFKSAWEKQKKNELNDLVLLGFVTLMIPLIWVIFLGWSPHLCISGNDATKILFPFYEDLAREKGNWQALLYRPEILGGFVIHGYFGSYPITRLLAWLNLSPLSILNWTFLSIHILFGFFSLRISFQLKSLLFASSKSIKSAHSPAPDQRPWIQHLSALAAGSSALALNAFAPVVAWRMAYGHPNILSGSFIFLSCLSLILSSLQQTLSITFFITALLALISCFEYQSYQMILYSGVFGAPILLAFLWPKTEDGRGDLKKTLPLLIWILGASAAASLGVIWPFVQHALSTDTARSILGRNIAYSYLTSSAMDWLSSLPWSQVLTSVARENAFFHHEINYPLGPLLLLLLLIPWKKPGASPVCKRLGLGLLLSVFLALTFSMRVEPIPSLLFAFIPPLKFFRVPARAILPFAFMLPILASSVLLAAQARLRHSPISQKKTAFLAGLGLVSFFFPSALREGFCWMLSCFAVLELKSFASQKIKPTHPLVIALILGMSSILEFSERLQPYWDQEFLETFQNNRKQEIYSQAPALKSALTRTLLGIEAEPFSLNRNYPLGVSTLSGYFSPPSRFISLFFALNQRPADIMAMAFPFTPNLPGYTALRELYNVAYQIAESPSQISVQPLLPAPIGEAWFSQKLQSFSSIEELAQSLNHQGAWIGAYLKDSLALVSADPMVEKANLPREFSPECQKARIQNVSAPQHLQKVTLQVETQADCPLTLSMNYIEPLTALGKTAQGAWIPLRVFPAYGALTGILVPAQIQEIQLEPKVKTPLWVQLIEGLGGMLILGLFIQSLRQGKSDPTC